MKNIYSIILGLILIFNINKINAQEATNDTIVPVSLQEVVVSTPFNESLQNNVIKVDKVNLNELGFLKSQSLSKALYNVPGISFITTGPGIQKPNIRGLSGNRVVTVFQNIRFENMQWGDEHGLEIHTSGISSIELIKGPMSVLYGSDAIGGVIYISPEKYLKENGLKVDIESLYNTNYSGITSSLGLNTTINKFSLLARASIIDNGDYENADGVVENTKFDMADLKFGIGFNSKGFESDLRLNFNSSTIGIPHEEHGDHDDHDDDDHDDDDHDDEHEEEEESYQELENTVISWRNSLKFNKSELQVTLGLSENLRKEFGHHEEEGHDDHDDDHDDDDHDDHEEHEEGEAHIDMQLQTTSLDFKYLFPKSDKFEFILGGSILNQENTNFGEEELIPNAEKQDLGFYGISHVHLNKLDLMVGFRGDQRDITTNSFNKSYSSFTASFGLKKNLGGSSVLRLNYASGYRAPNLSELFADGVHHGTARYEIGNDMLSVEKTNQIDLSLQTYSDMVTLGIDVFYNFCNNHIFLNPTGSSIEGMPVYNYSQADSNISGIEVMMSGKTNLDWLTYNTSLEYLSGKLEDGGYLPLISPLTFKLDFDLDFNQAGTYEIGLLSKANQNDVSDFETSTESYSLVDISGSYMLNMANNDLNLFWSVSNLFDKEYVDHLSRLKTLNIHDMGRNISVGLKYSF
jgi:iron complex outermembrane receptor protein